MGKKTSSGRYTFLIFVIVLGMIAALYYCLQITQRDTDPALISQITFSYPDYGLDLKPFHDEKENLWYLFLPACVNDDALSVNCSGNIQADFSDDGNLTLREGNQAETYHIEILQSENIPSIFVETSSGNMDYVNDDKENEEDMVTRVVDAEGNEQYRGTGTISGRGVSTWKAAKKPYNLKFSEKINLIGEESAKTWCLLANYFDSSQLRNALCYYAADEMGILYTSDIYFVSLYINGEYYGLYNAATKQDYKNAEGSEIYAVFEQSKSNKPYDYITDHDSYIRFRYGSESDVISLVNSFEDVLFDGNLTYEELGDYIDTNSFARKFLVELFFSNCDNRLSQYYAVDEEGIISTICAWDYDRSIGISNFRYVDLSYNMLYMANRWYQALMQYDEFQKEVFELFLEYADFLQNTIFEYLNRCTEEIRSDWEMNAVRWDGYYSKRTALKTKTEDVSTLDGNRDYIETFLKKRFDFLNDYWSDPGKYSAVSFYDDTVGDYTIYCETGLPLSDDQLPDGLLSYSGDDFEGWYTAEGLSLDEVSLITEDLTFYGKREGPSSNVAAADKGQESVLITMLKKGYHFFGLESFGGTRLLICAVFGVIFLIVIAREILEWRRKKRRRKWMN